MGDKKLEDGFKTTISFATGASGDVLFWETEVSPIGVSGGGKIDTTTMRNSELRTAAAKSLKEILAASLVAAYATDIYTSIMTMINVNQLITITFPDASFVSFWGFLNEFQPNGLTEGDMPLADLSIEVTNQDDSGVETEPTWPV